MYVIRYIFSCFSYMIRPFLLVSWHFFILFVCLQGLNVKDIFTQLKFVGNEKQSILKVSFLSLSFIQIKRNTVDSHYLQGTLSKGLSEILRDIRTLTYQICGIEEKIKRLITFHKLICNLTPEVGDILKIL